jgi:hypothetical protein
LARNVPGRHSRRFPLLLPRKEAYVFEGRFVIIIAKLIPADLPKARRVAVSGVQDTRKLRVPEGGA